MNSTPATASPAAAMRNRPNRTAPRRHSAARRIVLAAMLAAVMQAAAAATVPLSGSLVLSATAKLGDEWVFDSDSKSWGFGPPLQDLAASAAVSATPVWLSPTAGATAAASASGLANWDSASRGWVRFGNWGWQVDSLGLSAEVKAGNAYPNWSYTFIAGAQDLSFVFDYQVLASGDFEGLGGWSMQLTGGPEGKRTQLTSQDPLDPRGSGWYELSLTAGEEYKSWIWNESSRTGSPGLKAAADMSARFDWHISSQPVPEPGTWALLLAGLAATAGAARHRRGTGSAVQRPQ